MNNKKVTMDIKTFTNLCHTIYDKLHGEKKISLIFGLEEKHIHNLFDIYLSNYLTRINKIHNYISRNTTLDPITSSFYINAFQHYCDYVKNN